MFMFTLETKEKNKGQGSAVPGKPPKQWQKEPSEVALQMMTGW